MCFTEVWMPPPPRVDVERVRQLVRQGVGVRGIAYRLGVTTAAIYRVRRELRRGVKCG